MRIAILVEGDTERVFKPYLISFLQERLADKMPRLEVRKYDGRVPKGDKLNKVVTNLLSGPNPVDAVIALSDVYTGQRDFADAADAKAQMNAAVDKQWLGSNPRFFAHVALYDFEAWLLPFWAEIQALAQHNRSAPGGQPETVNHTRPPSSRIKEIFSIGKIRGHYVKPRDAKRILDDAQRSRQESVLLIAANACPELKVFLNTILKLCSGEEIS